MGSFFSVNDLTSCVGGKENLENLTINAGVNFLKGKVTSTFSAINSDSQELTKVTIANKKTKKKIRSRSFQSIDKANEFIKKDKEKKQAKLDEEGDGKTVDELYEYIISNKTVGTISSLAEAPLNALGTIGMISNLANMDIPGFTTNICVNVANRVVEESMSLINDATSRYIKLTLEYPNLVKEHTLKSFNDNKMTLNDFLKELTADAEDEVEMTEEEQEKEDNEENSKSLLQTFNEIKGQVLSVVNDINETMEKITPYISEGPEIVTKMIDNEVSSKIDKVKGITNSKILGLEEETRKKAKEIGEILGQQLANKYNDALKRAAEKQMNSLKKAKTKAQLLAFKAKQAAALQIMKLTGVNVKI